MDYSDMDAVEAADSLSWHDRRRSGLVERSPEPLDLTDTEIADFDSEYVLLKQHVDATRDTPDVVILECREIGTVKAQTYRKAICLAAAKWKEINE